MHTRCDLRESHPSRPTFSYYASLTAGSIQLDIVNGTVNAIRFSISGSTQIVLTQAQISLDAEMSFPSNMTGDDCAVPDAVLSALKK